MTEIVYFVDANVPMYAVGTAHPLKAACLAILRAAASHQITVVTDAEVLQEILHRYTALGQRERAVEVARLFVSIVPRVLPITKESFVLAAELHLLHQMLPARDSLHAAVIREHGLTALISADRHFDRIPGLRRVDPADWPE